MAGRNSQLIRCLRMIELLKSRRYGLSVEEIREELASWGITVSKRTIYRDLDVLSVAGVMLTEIENNEGGQKKWVILGSES